MTVSQTQFAFSFSSQPQFSHIVVFILPGNSLPPDAAAAVYIQFPGRDFKLLGAIGNEKQSAIFKVNFPNTQAGAAEGVAGGRLGGDEMVDETPQAPGGPDAGLMGDINLGISVEPKASVAEQLANVERQSGSSTAMVKRPPSTKILAQRIIKNAFNFLASFAGGQGGNEMVPLRSFQDWWTKFERRVENDPGFLERDDEG